MGEDHGGAAGARDAVLATALASGVRVAQQLPRRTADGGASAIKINGDYIHTPIGKQPCEVPRAARSV